MYICTIRRYKIKYQQYTESHSRVQSCTIDHRTHISDNQIQPTPSFDLDLL